MNFGEKLKIIRKALNLTQQELADRLGVTKQAISRYENSERDPNLRTAKDFSEKLGIDLTVLSDDDLCLPHPNKLREEHELVSAYRIASLKYKNMARIALGLEPLAITAEKNSGQGNIINLSDYIKRSLE